MTKNIPGWCLWMAAASLAVGTTAVSCGGGGDGGGSSSGTGGDAGAGMGGDAGAGTGGGSGGRTEADIDELISGICDWEFHCCNSGELKYRFGAFSQNAERCAEQFVFQLRESNTTDNPFPGGAGLLGTLGYVVNLDRVEPNPQGIAACLNQYNAMGCNEDVEPTHCEGPADPGSAPCALHNLFLPKLGLGERCTLALAEGNYGGNDVECMPGSTCLEASHPANDADFPACVQRGVSGQPCTQNADCDFNFYCDGGQCTEKGSAEDACAFNDPDQPVLGDESKPCKAGLSCNPNTLKCTENCSLDHICTNNLECPEGLSCVPITVGDDSTSFKACRELGNSGDSRCDDDDDCVDGRYCNASGNCVSQVAVDADCTSQGMCPEGSFCDTSLVTPDLVVDDLAGPPGAPDTKTPAELKCTSHYNASQPCYPPAAAGHPSGCGSAAPHCLLNVGEEQWRCASQRRAEGAKCYPFAASLPSECQPGLHCEAVNSDPWPYECTSGAGLGDECDTNIHDDTAPRCGAGLTCIDGACVAQSDPGGSCEDPDTGNANAALCKNGVCVDQWDELICSDAPVPQSAGGDNLTCSG